MLRIYRSYIWRRVTSACTFRNLLVVCLMVAATMFIFGGSGNTVKITDTIRSFNVGRLQPAGDQSGFTPVSKTLSSTNVSLSTTAPTLNTSVKTTPTSGAAIKPSQIHQRTQHPPEGSPQDDLNTETPPSDGNPLSIDEKTTIKDLETELAVETERIGESLVPNNGSLEEQSNDSGVKTNILFLKTHKCGTSSLVNVFFIFGLRRKLNFVLEPFKRPLNIQASVMLPPRAGQHYNIQCSHAKFYADYIHRYLPKERTTYTTIVRSPLKHFISGFLFFGADRALRHEKASVEGLTNFTLDESINEWLSSDPAFAPNATHAHLSLYINGLALDLGFELFLNRSGLTLQQKIDQFIKHIDDEFDFVMLTDFFHESLILLKNLMGWRYEDMFYFNRMTYNNDRKHEDLSPETVNRIYEYNKIDVQLYKHFHDKFQKAIDRYGRDALREDVAKFEDLRHTFQIKCFNNEADAERKFYQLTSTPTICRFLKASDILMARMASQFQITNDMTVPDINGTLARWAKSDGSLLEPENVNVVKELQTDWEREGYDQFASYL